MASSEQVRNIGRFAGRSALAGLALSGAIEASCVTPQATPDVKPITSSQRPPEPPAIEVVSQRIQSGPTPTVEAAKVLPTRVAEVVKGTPEVQTVVDEKGNTITNLIYPSGLLEISETMPADRPELMGQSQARIDLSFPNGVKHNFEKGSLHMVLNPAYWQRKTASPAAALVQGLFVLTFDDNYGQIVRFTKSTNSPDLTLGLTTAKSTPGQGYNQNFNTAQAVLPGSRDFNAEHIIDVTWGSSTPWKLDAIAFDAQTLPLGGPQTVAAPRT